ncbi:MAG: PD-(D/E)XK nuclease family protein [Armatimonadetes bacterium]|nr:PD-(D/E)XK nuclease family protein [Armatimonadota bacterium]
MSPQIIMLGRRRPQLQAVTDWLEGRYLLGPVWDMSTVLVVVSGRRAVRRLGQLIADRSARLAPTGGLTVFPPRIVTVGALPETLCPALAPALSPMAALIAMRACLRDLPGETLNRVSRAHPDGERDLWPLAKRLCALRSELGADLFSCEDVARSSAAMAGPDADRWAALAEIEDAYERALRTARMRDAEMARREADLGPTDPVFQHVVLAGTADLRPVHRKLLDRCCLPVTALVAADADDAAGFDDLGCVVTEYWLKRRTDIAGDQIIYAETETDAAGAVLERLQAWGGDLSADQVTVGLGDEAGEPLVERMLAFAGVPVRTPLGGPATRSRPGALLSGVADWLHTGSAEALAELVRHPDLARRLRRDHDAPGDLPDLMDRYRTRHLPGPAATAVEPDAQRFRRLASDLRRVRALLHRLSGDAAPATWAARFQALLAGIYRDVSLQPDRPDDAYLLRALKVTGGALDDLASVPATGPTGLRIGGADALQLVIDRMAVEALTVESAEAAVEIVGWLEVPADDANGLILLGLHEGRIPSSMRRDPFLTESLRSALGLPDSDHRYARDAHGLTSALAGRTHAALICARKTDQGDPLMPSRFLFAASDEETGVRVKRFVSGDAFRLAHAPPASSGPRRLRMPTPELAPPLTKLDPSSFRRYLNCRYRYYLRSVIGLTDARDDWQELSPAMFGDLAHAVLSDLARSEPDVRETTQAASIRSFLRERLATHAADQYGRRPMGSVRLQVAQLERRLDAFATKQAERNARGWRILPEHTEADLSATLDVDGAPVTIAGRIDRLDHHPELGYAVLDYKTGKALEPDKAHRTKRDGALAWTNLQLPIYRFLVQSTVGAAEPIGVGYVALPDDPDATAFTMAPWVDADYASAMECADDVVRRIRRGEFWPPSEPPSFDDGLQRLCWDRIPQRGAAIQEAIAPATGQEAPA